MKNKWNKRVSTNQLDIYSTKRKFTHTVTIPSKPTPAPTPSTVFQQNNIINNSGRHIKYLSSIVIRIDYSKWTPPNDIKIWLKENIDDGYYKFGDDKNEYCFTRLEDAIAFKIYWSS